MKKEGEKKTHAHTQTTNKYIKFNGNQTETRQMNCRQEQETTERIEQ